MNSRVLCTISTEAFRNKAYADYLAEVASEYANFTAMIASATEDLGLDESGEVIPIETRISTLLSEYHFDGQTSVSMPEGATSIHDLLYWTIQQSDRYSNSADDSGPTSLDEKVFSLVRFESGTTVNLSYNEVVDSVKNTFHSLVCTMSAMAASTQESVSDRLQVYKDTISGYFANVYADMSGTFDYYKQILQNKENTASSIGNTVLSALNIFGRDVDYEDDSITTSTLYQYTGASPVPALDFSCAIKAVTSTARVVAKAVSDIAKGIWNVVKPLFKKVVKAFTDVVTVNDIEVIDKNSEVLSVDGWTLESIGDALTWYIPTDSYFNEFFWKYASKWIKFETIFGEVLIQFESYRKVSTGLYACSTTIKVKPYPINYLTVGKIYSNLGFPIQTTAANMDLVIQRGSRNIEDYVLGLQQLAEDHSLYLDDLTNEPNMYQGYQTGYILMMHAFNIAAHEAIYDDSEFSAYWQNINIPEVKSNVLNNDWIQLLCGWDKNVSNPTFADTNVPGLPVRLINPSQITALDSYQCLASAVLNAFACQYMDRQENPLSWTFIPYRNNVANFLSARYGIKTDVDNQKALTTLITVATLVVITVVVAVTAKVVISKIRKKAFFKKLEFQGRMDNMMWNGGSMTAAEKRKYIRYSRKLNASSLLTSGLSDNLSPSNFFPTDSGSVNTDGIITLIRG